MAIEDIYYEGNYNPHFRPVTYEEIITVEISPTGSGKTYFYKDAHHTIMLMPTNALVRQNDGMISTANARANERSSWDELRTDRCDYMTYDKFAGHMMREDLSQFNIIIDEANLLLSSTAEVHYKLAEALFTRSFCYKELKLISATLRPEVLELYSSEETPLRVQRYLKQGYTPQIHFSSLCPPITPHQRTLFFINSVDKILQMKEKLEREFPEIRTLILQSESEFPQDDAFEQYDVIFATSVIKQGYSIKTHIDQVILYNVYHPVGAIDIVQYMARPRNQQPPMYVICAKTHFGMRNPFIPSLENLWNYLYRHSTGDEAYQANVALEINTFLARSKFSNTSWNVLGVVNYYEEQMKFAELYDDAFETMRKSLMQMIPQAIITLGDEIEDGIEVSFRPIKIDLSLGSKIIHIPFNLYLQDFQLERYPGSHSPSSFASEVTLKDERNGETFNKRIFMNNILNHGGFRFYQSSYDTDERGTVLSVNHDYVGTIVTYLGYLLLAISMIWALITKNSRFRLLLNKCQDIAKSK